MFSCVSKMYLRLLKLSLKYITFHHSYSTLSCVKPITVHIEANFYTKLATKYPIQFATINKIPQNGIELTVDYADNSLGCKVEKNRTILAIHGVPGYYSHFDQLIRHYGDTRVRVIAPNMPDFAHTRSSGGTFWHTTEEKVEFVKNFLGELKVDQIDCLVSHSTGFQTLAGLCANPGNLYIKSVALFAPQPMWNVLTPTYHRLFFQMFLFKSNAWYNLLSLFCIHRHPIWRMNLASINECLWTVVHLLDKQTQLDIHHRIESMRNMNIPIVIMYGTKERVISEVNVKKLLRAFGVTSNDQCIHVNPLESIDCKMLDGPSRVKAVIIENGGHFAYAKHKECTFSIIDNLLSNQF